MLILILAVFGCSSPLDVDTPREIDPMQEDDPIPVSLKNANFEINGTSENFAIEEASAEIDTSKDKPLFWGSFSFKTNKITSFNKKRLIVTAIKLEIDKMEITVAPKILGKYDNENSLAQFDLCRGVSAAYNVTVNSDTSRNKVKIFYSLDEESKQIFMTLNAKVYQTKYWLDNNDEIKQAPDSLFINGELKFNY